MNNPSHNLRAAKALISKPEAWTQGEYARDADGKAVTSADLSACKWCSVGSINKVAWNGGERDRAKDYLHSALAVRNIVTDIPAYNDSSSHEEVLAMFDKAIALAENDESLENK